MEIIKQNFNFNGILQKRNSTNYIILHHRAGNGDVQSIHQTHLDLGWSGIGYHFYVRKNGKIYEGRPIDKVGAHTTNYNSKSIGVCFEGNFENEKMCDAQINSANQLVSYLKNIYPNSAVKLHKDFNQTVCPGKNFPFERIVGTEFTLMADIVKELSKRGIITDIDKWLKKINTKNDGYWLCCKGCNMTENIKTPKDLQSVNDIVWELNRRSIMTDKNKWLKLLYEDIDLYWLAKKICNMTKNKEG